MGVCEMGQIMFAFSCSFCVRLIVVILLPLLLNPWNRSPISYVYHNEQSGYEGTPAIECCEMGSFLIVASSQPPGQQAASESGGDNTP